MLNAASKIILFTIGIALMIVNALMFFILLGMFTGVIELDVQQNIMGFIVLTYLIGALGVSFLTRSVFKTLQGVIDESNGVYNSQADQIARDAYDRQVMKDFFADINRNFTTREP